jgi:hypothetical protein
MEHLKSNLLHSSLDVTVLILNTLMLFKEHAYFYYAQIYFLPQDLQ